MALPAGTRVGGYEILSSLGAGGMGEVYRARDTRLGREIAMKVLPDAVAADPERIARFEREAKVLASLNHHNIAALFGMDEGDGRHFLIMELVEGQTLAERIDTARAQGTGVPVEEALAIAVQIAEGLEAAHEKGIVHRDLKPANVKITPDGKVKVLDFGLAKAIETEATAANLAHSPTLSMMATQAGMILGTAAYMSPEQAKGFAADHRSDVFSFGVVLCEMLTGRQPFQGETAPDILASVLAREPDLHTLPPNLNPRLADLVRRCLEKLPKRRWQAIGDVRAELEMIAAQPHAAPASAGPPAAPPRPRWQRAIPIGIAAVIFAAIGGGVAWNLRPVTPLQISRSVFELPEGQTFTNPGRKVLALSPDGSQIAYVVNGRLYLRHMSEFEGKPVAGAESEAGVLNPVFSPDGQSIAFWSQSDEAIKRIAVNGGAPIVVCEATRPFGMSWQDDGIVFGQSRVGISRVSAGGGKPEILVSVNDAELAHGPQILPGGQVVLFTLARGTGNDRWEKAEIIVQRLSSGERTTLIRGGSDARYVSTGHLVYALGNVLLAVPFNLNRLEVTGDAVALVQGVRRATVPTVNTGAAHFDFSNTGSLVYVPGVELDSGATALALLDRKGNVELLKLPPGSYETPRMSPDGKRIAYSSAVGSDQIISVYDTSGASSPRRLTFGGQNRFPVWSPDGVRVAFQSDRDGDPAIFWQRADGTDAAERLTKPEPGASHIPESWSPDGETLLFSAFNQSVFSSWTLTTRDRKSQQFSTVRSSFVPDATFSPDGAWVAYRASGPGPSAVFVEPFPPTGVKYQITGGASPVWSRDGTELFVAAGRMSVVSIKTRPSVTFGQPAVAAAGVQVLSSGLSPRTFDISPDGRILGVVNIESVSTPTPTTPRIHIVVNWFEELKAQVRIR